LKHAKELLQLALTILAIGAVAYLFDFDRIVSVLAGAKPTYILAALACYVGINLCMAYRIKILIGGMGTDIGYRQAVMSHFAGMLASDFTPARSGYFATAFALSKNGASMGQSMAAILGPQIFDFSLKVVAGSVGVAFVALAFGLEGAALAGTVLGILAVLGMIVIAILLVFSSRFLGYFRELLARLPFGARVYGIFESMQKHSGVVKEKIGFVLGLMLITWVLKGLEWMFLAQAIGMEPAFAYPVFIFYMCLQPLVTILQFVPFPTLAGAGLSEAGAVGVLFFFGVGAPQAAAFALLTRGLMVFVDLIGLAQIRRLDLEKILESRHF